MKLFGLLLIIIGIVLGMWLGVVVMLYGGIMQVVTNWNVDTSLVVWGIIRAIFFEIGLYIGWFVVLIGAAIVAIS